MVTIAILAFREFFEAFLIVSVFFGISKRLALKKEKELLYASAVGLVISFLLPVLVFFFGQYVKGFLNHENAELVEAYLVTFSGLFIAYVVFSLHRFMEPNRHKKIRKVKDQLIQHDAFNVSLLLTIVFFIAREGFEIAILTAASTVFSGFLQNLYGLFIGFIAAALVGVAIFFSYIKTPVCKIFRYTEYTIVLFGAAMVKNGISELVEQYFHLRLGDILPIRLVFLPSDEEFAGHLVKQLFGFEQDFSVTLLTLMLAYIACMYLFFFKPEKIEVTPSSSPKRT
jgi:FTR1 family protein